MYKDLDKIIEERAKFYDIKLIDKVDVPVELGLKLKWSHYKSIESIKEDLERLQQNGATHVRFLEYLDEDRCLDIISYKEQ